MRFGVLGPLQIRDDSGGRELPAPTPRRVLAMLLTAPNRPVSVDTLITELWGEKPPRLARKTVQTHVYQLRRELRARGSGPVIETCHDGYLVRLGPGELDLWEFEEGVAAGEGAARRGGRARHGPAHRRMPHGGAGQRAPAARRGRAR